jgi:replicative DNA helicase
MNETTTVLVPPFDLEAEEIVLGRLIRTGLDALDVFKELGLDSADFYRPAHSHLFDYLVQTVSQGESLAPADLVKGMNAAQVLPYECNELLINDLSDRARPGVRTKAAAMRVIEASQRRELITAANIIAEAAYDNSVEIGYLLKYASLTATQKPRPPK